MVVFSKPTGRNKWMLLVGGDWPGAPTVGTGQLFEGWRASEYQYSHPTHPSWETGRVFGHELVGRLLYYLFYNSIDEDPGNGEQRTIEQS